MNVADVARTILTAPSRRTGQPASAGPAWLESEAGGVANFQGDLFGDSRDWSDLAPDRPARQCSGRPVIVTGPNGEMEVHRPCGNFLPDLCFSSTTSLKTTRTRCVACEYNIRAARKRLHRFEYRAKNALYKHMARERAEGLNVCRRLSDYEELTGITLPYVEERMRISALNDHRCEGNCAKRWSEMDGGWRMNMTVDRPDPSRPLARDNFALKCTTDNTGERDTDPRTRNVRQAMWRRINRDLP